MIKHIKVQKQPRPDTLKAEVIIRRKTAKAARCERNAIKQKVTEASSETTTWKGTNNEP